MQFIPWQPERGHAGLSKEGLAERCALTTDEQLAKLTAHPEYLAWEGAQHFNAAKPARSWLSWLPLRSRRATIVALLLLCAYIVSQSALLGIGQLAAFWPSTPHTGTETPASLPAGLYFAAHDESAAAAVSASLGDLGEADTPRADYPGQDLNTANTEQDSGPGGPDIELQTQAKQGQEKEVLSLELGPANDEPETPPQDHVSQESSGDAVSEATHNSHIPGTESLAAAQRFSPFSVSEALWELFALLALSTAVSKAARWRKTRVRRDAKKRAINHEVRHPGNEAHPNNNSKRVKPGADKSSDKENKPELSRHSDTTILAAKGATNSDLAESADLRRQLDEASHAASLWEGSYRAATEALLEKRKNLKTKVARAAQEINSLQEKIQDRESRLKKVVLDCQLHDNSETIEAQQLQETVKKLQSDVQVLVAERDALRTQNTALEALWETAQQAAAPAPQPSPPMLHEHEGASAALGDGAASNEMEESDDCSTATEDIDEGEPLSSVYERRRARRQRRELKPRSMRSS